MRRLLFYIFFFLYNLAIGVAQDVLSADFPVAGDTLYLIETKVRKVAFPEKVGSNLTWNFLFLDAPYVKEILFASAEKGDSYQHFPESDVVAIGANRDEVYYRREENQIVELGRYGQLSWLGKRTGLIKFDKFPIVKMFNSGYNSSYHNSVIQTAIVSMDELEDWGISSLPFYGESLKIETAIMTKSIIDGEGEVLLPFGNYQVLQERMEITRETKIFAKTEIGWEEIDPAYVAVDEDYLQLGITRKTNYRYWTPEFAYPLLNIEDVSRDMYQVTYINDDLTSQLFTANSTRKDILALPNPSFGEVTFQFLNFAPGTYTLHLFNIINKPLYSEKLRIGSSLQKNVDLTFLDKGTYIYSIIDSNGNKLFTKKIVILRP